MSHADRYDELTQPTFSVQTSESRHGHRRVILFRALFQIHRPLPRARHRDAEADSLEPYTYLRFVFTDLSNAERRDAIDARLAYSLDRERLILPRPP